VYFGFLPHFRTVCQRHTIHASRRGTVPQENPSRDDIAARSVRTGPVSKAEPENAKNDKGLSGFSENPGTTVQTAPFLLKCHHLSPY
jgi:hypothetical protein